MIEDLMKDHPLLSFIIVPAAVIAAAGIFMSVAILFISIAIP